MNYTEMFRELQTKAGGCGSSSCQASRAKGGQLVNGPCQCKNNSPDSLDDVVKLAKQLGYGYVIRSDEEGASVRVFHLDSGINTDFIKIGDITESFIKALYTAEGRG